MSKISSQISLVRLPQVKAWGSVTSAASPGTDAKMNIGKGQSLIVTGSTVRVNFQTVGKPDVICVHAITLGGGTRFICPDGFDSVRFITASAAATVYYWLEETEPCDWDPRGRFLQDAMQAVIVPRPGAQVVANTAVGGTSTGIRAPLGTPFIVSTDTAFQLFARPQAADQNTQVEATLSAGNTRVVAPFNVENLLVRHASLTRPVQIWIEESERWC